MHRCTGSSKRIWRDLPVNYRVGCVEIFGLCYEDERFQKFRASCIYYIILFMINFIKIVFSFMYMIAYDFEARNTSISTRKNRDYVSIDSIFLPLMFRKRSISNIFYSPIPMHRVNKKRGIFPISRCYFVESNIRLRSARKYSIQ